MIILRVIVCLIAFIIDENVGIVVTFCNVLAVLSKIATYINERRRVRAQSECYKSNINVVYEQPQTNAKLQKLNEKIAKMEMQLSTAQTDIDYLEPKRSEIVASIRDIEEKRRWRTANGHYEDADSKVEKELDRLKTKLYQIDKKLEKARFNYETAERFLEEIDY